MKQLVAAVFTLTAIVAGIVVATSLSSPAQENDDAGDTTTSTIPADPDWSHRFGFGFRFDGELPPELADLAACLREAGIDIPEEVDGPFMFDLRSEDIDGLAEALEACGLPSFEDRFSGRLPFDGDHPEHFPFGDEFPEGFPFGGEAFEFPEGFPFGGEAFEFHFGGPRLDLDDLASCLAELEGFGVDQIREKLDECLPARPDLDGLNLPGFDGFGGHGRGGFGFPFGGDGPFGFEFDDRAPGLEGTST